MRMFVRRDSAVKLIDGLAGESPASAGYPVGTVVISGDGAGDQTVGSPEVRAEQRVVQEGSSPSGARMRGAISKSGGNSSLAEESRRYADA